MIQSNRRKRAILRGRRRRPDLFDAWLRSTVQRIYALAMAATPPGLTPEEFALVRVMMHRRSG